MTLVVLYACNIGYLENVLPVVLEKLCEIRSRVLVKTKDEKQTKYIDELLWRYKLSSFLPHSAKDDEFTAQQPIFITNDSVKNYNSAQSTVILEGAHITGSIRDYRNRVVYIFNQNSKEYFEYILSKTSNFKNEANIKIYRQGADNKWNIKSL